MKWEVFIPPQDAGSMQTTVTVEAKNWLSALNAGLKQLGEQGDMAANLMCDVRDDGSIHITDYKTRRVFQLRNLANQAAADDLPPAERTSFLESKSSVRPSKAPQEQGGGPVQESFIDSEAPPTPVAVAEHKVFFSRDENPTTGSNLIYRERLIASTEVGEREVLESLLMHYFETLRRSVTTLEGAKYINLAVYTEEFKGRPPGPPVGALSWQDWKDREPQISFPSVEPAKVETSFIPPDTAPAEPAPAEPAPPVAAPSQPAAKPSNAPPAPDNSSSSLGATTPAGSQVPAPPDIPDESPAAAPAPPAEAPAATAAPAPQREHVRRRTPSQQMHIGRNVQMQDTGEILAEVFEEMQDLYITQDQEEAADFVLNLAMKKIPAEAGSVFLADINTRELYFAAVHGPTAEKLKGQRLMMTTGLVGFAARRGAAIAISDVTKDPRFCDEFDSSSGFVTKSVVCAPVQYEGRSFGAMEILNRKGGDSFSQGEVNIISYISTQLAEYIATSLPSAEPDFDVDESKKAPPPAAAAPKAKAKAKGKKGKKGKKGRGRR
ncbi:MAG: GAF domain-containing protein [Deltaproteobacteria bacterium]|nr:GAF domain-containing protein [Deltaproteobacteria bacterium]